MTDLPDAFAHLTQPMQVIGVLIVAALTAIATIVRSCAKSPDMPLQQRRLMWVALFFAVVLPAAASTLIAFGGGAVVAARPPVAPQAGGSIAPQTEVRPDTILPERRVAVPDVVSPTSAGQSGPERSTRMNAPQPSFDCAKAGFADESAICADAGLRQADGALGRTYRAVLATLTVSAHAQLVATQRAWIVERRTRCGASVSCLREALQSRSSLLESMLH